MTRPLLLLVLLATLLQAGVARAEPFPVTNLEDDGTGSLREAIKAANGHPGADTIPISATGTILLEVPLPAVTDNVTISGPGSGSLTVTRSGTAPEFRILTFVGSSSTVSDLEVREGVEEAAGGGILNSGGSLTLVRVVVAWNEVDNIGSGVRVAGGGGIFSTGALTLRESIVRLNQVTAGSGAENTAAGGGIESEGSLIVERSTISGNSAAALALDGATTFAGGGGIAQPGGSVTIEESTVSGNSVRAAGATAQNVAVGGGIDGSVAGITGATLSGNSAVAEADDGGALASALGGNLASPAGGIIRDTLLANPQGTAESCSTGILSGGFNLDEDGSCGLEAGSDLNGVAAGLDPVLRDNGGPTPTHALLSGSIAIDRGNSFGSSVDQRNLPRPSDFPAISNKEGGDGSDIGAFELQVPPDGGPPLAVPILVGSEPGDTTPPRTRIVSGPARSGYERQAKFRFTSSEGQSSFQCKLDGKRWKKCRSPYKLTVKPGKHLFKVRAIDRFGNVDATPARFGWRVKPVG